MPKHFVISIMARDRVGIVADVATAIRSLDGNLGDLSQTVLRGHFTMILVVSFPDSVSQRQIRETLSAIGGDDPFEIGVKASEGPLPEEPGTYDERRYVLTAAGPDRVGLVAHITQYLAQKRINVEDLATRVDDGKYTMILLLDLPPETNMSRLQRGLRLAAQEVGIEAELQHHGIFRATSEI